MQNTRLSLGKSRAEDMSSRRPFQAKTASLRLTRARAALVQDAIVQGNSEDDNVAPLEGDEGHAVVIEQCPTEGKDELDPKDLRFCALEWRITPYPHVFRSDQQRFYSQ